MDFYLLNQWLLFYNKASTTSTEETLHHTAELQLLHLFVSESKIRVMHYIVTKQNATLILNCSAH